MELMGITNESYDQIVTSGDVTRELIAEGPRKIFHLGPERELAIYDGLDVELVEEYEASAVVCTGLVDDEIEKPEDYAEMLQRFRSRNLPFICANPDIIVERGTRLIWCAGALARDYTQLGGRTLIAGKPHNPIYVAAMQAAEELMGKPVDKSRILAIGDGMLTEKSQHLIVINFTLGSIISRMNAARDIQHIQAVILRAFNIGQQIERAHV